MDADQITTSVSTPLSEFWRTDITSFSSGRAVINAQHNRPAVGSDNVYCGGIQSEFVAVSRSDAESTAWTKDRTADAKTGHLSDSSAYYYDVPNTPELFFGGGYGVLYGFAKDGSDLWSQQFKIDSAVTCTPVVLNGDLYFGTNDGRLFRLDRADGSEVWTNPVDVGGPVLSTLEADSGGGVIYLTTYDGRVVGIDENRNETMSFDTGTKLIASSPEFDSGTVYVAADVVYALNTDGTVSWRSDQDSTANYGGTTGSSPVAAGGNIYVGSADGSVYAFDASNGTLQWETSIGNSVPSTPAIAGSGSQVIVATQAGDLVVLKASDGTEDDRIGNFTTETLSSPTVDNGEVFIGTENAEFVGFR